MSTKKTFQQIFRDQWGEFVVQYSRYKEKNIIIEKMLGCGDPANGYSEYICPDCLETKRVLLGCQLGWQGFLCQGTSIYLWGYMYIHKTKLP